MADVDEDVIPRELPSADDIDLSDETQDFRFLAALSKSSDAKIPKRGEKDFEHHATVLQSDTLAASRQAMHNALAVERVHQPRGHTIATYHPESNMAYAYNPKGVLYSKIGQVLPANEDPFGDDGRRGQRVWLLPEEVIYMLERGSLDVRWPATPEDEDGNGLPMSLQGAYAMFIGNESSRGGLSLERYSVYAALKRLGYIVNRAPSWSGPGPPSGKECFAPTPDFSWRLGLLSPVTIVRWIFGTLASDEEHAQGPMVRPGLYRNYADIYRRLALIPSYDPRTRSASSKPSGLHPDTDPDFRITFHVWKPGSTTFKKSAPGPPDFRIAVVNARTTSVPSLQQLSALMDTTPYDPPKDNAQLYAKLKHGYKNVILAIVDQGVTSYMRVADAAFGTEKLYERKGRPPGGKRGGKGGRGKKR